MGFTEQPIADLGQKLREARSARNISLREVARRVGLSASLISQIERGQVNPSVSSLYSIANVLGLSMDYFFNDAPLTAPTPVVRSGDRPVVNIAGGVEWQSLMSRQDQTVEFMQIRYEVGSSSGDAAYRHQGREYGVVIQGNITVELGFNSYLLEAGDSICFDSSVPHRLVNTGDVPMIGIWLILDRQ